MDSRFFCFFFKVYLFERERERKRGHAHTSGGKGRGTEEKADSPLSRERDTGLNPRTLGS